MAKPVPKPGPASSQKTKQQQQPSKVSFSMHLTIHCCAHASSDAIRAQCTQTLAHVPLPRVMKEEEEEVSEEEGVDFDSQDLDEFVGQGGEGGDEEEEEDEEQEEEEPVVKKKKIKVCVLGQCSQPTHRAEDK